MTDAPIATYRYSLTWQDALAYERLPKSMSGLQQTTFYIWLALAGVLLVALPPELMGETGSRRFWLTGAALLVLQYAIFWAGRTVMRLNRARSRFPVPVEMAVEQQPDHFVVSSDARPRRIGYEDIGMLLPAAGHLFMAVGRDLIIIPAAAFPAPDGIKQLAAEIDAYMRDKYASAAPACEQEDDREGDDSDTPQSP